MLHLHSDPQPTEHSAIARPLPDQEPVPAARTPQPQQDCPRQYPASGSQRRRQALPLSEPKKPPRLGVPDDSDRRPVQSPEKLAPDPESDPARNEERHRGEHTRRKFRPPQASEYQDCPCQKRPDHRPVGVQIKVQTG